MKNIYTHKVLHKTFSEEKCKECMLAVFKFQERYFYNRVEYHGYSFIFTNSLRIIHKIFEFLKPMNNRVKWMNYLLGTRGPIFKIFFGYQEAGYFFTIVIQTMFGQTV